MKWATEERHLQEEWLKNIKSIKVLAPFGIKRDYINQNTKIITRKGRKNIPVIGKRKTNDQIHAKLVIGENSLLTGSSNFTSNSLENLHEIMFKFEKDNHHIFYNKMQDFFDSIWKKSEKFNGINDLS